MGKLLYNAIRTPDGTVLVSRHRHDYKTYIDKNGFEYMVDGGLDYQRFNVVDQAPHENLSVVDDGLHTTRREHLCWGKNYDKDMNRLSETQWIPIMDMDTDHIKAVLENIKNLSPFYKEVFENELEYRSHY